MTTVAYKDGLMAADRQLGRDKKVVTKIFRLSPDAPDGYQNALVGLAATDYPVALQTIDWLNGLTERPDLMGIEQLEMLIVTEGGGIQLSWKELLPVDIENPYYAIGSGGEYALGALAMGASADEAVATAHKFDSGTGDKQTHLWLK